MKVKHCLLSLTSALVALAIIASASVDQAKDESTICRFKQAGVTRVSAGTGFINKELMVQLHREARATVNPPAANMQLIQWDDAVAAVAKAWADKCVTAHSGNKPYGENIAWGFPDMESATRAWIAEKKDWTYNTVGAQQKGVVGHYTAIIWADTKKVGCGLANCPNGQDFLVCNYFDDRGNWSGEHPYQLAATPPPPPPPAPATPPAVKPAPLPPAQQSPPAQAAPPASAPAPLPVTPVLPVESPLPSPSPFQTPAASAPILPSSTGAAAAAASATPISAQTPVMPVVAPQVDSSVKEVPGFIFSHTAQIGKILKTSSACQSQIDHRVIGLALTIGALAFAQMV